MDIGEVIQDIHFAFHVVVPDELKEEELAKESPVFLTNGILSQDLKAAIPEAEGFSRQNLQYMKKMYLLYGEASANCPQLVGNSENEICQQVVGISQGINYDIIFSIPWGHHRTIIDKYFEKGERETALFYVHKIVEDGWSRNVLKSFIDTHI